MISLIFIIVFLFCLALAIASCWIAYQFTTTYNTKFHKTYFYYLITFFGFGFYGIWSQILMTSLLLSTDTAIETIKTVANFLPVLGVPFLIISWIMLTKMGYYLVQTNPKKNLINVHLIILGAISILICGIFFILKEDHWLFREHLVYTEIGILVFIEFIYLTFFFRVVLVHAKKYKKQYKNIINQFILLLILGFLLRVLVLFLHEVNTFVIAPLLLIYFLSNFFPVFYLRLKSDLIFSPVSAEHPSEEKKAMLFSKYKITKREKEIIDKICQGKTNQQIADELFIGLQTVKDHTHRIYSKVGINSRLKLVQMINS